MSEPVWVLRSIIDAVHDMQLAEHGGAAGVRDEGLLESPLARPVNAHAYGETDLCTLAASYTFGIVRNHPFVDGNKRTAFLAAFVFLAINGLELIADEVSATTAMMSITAGNSNELEFSDWLRANVQKSIR